jgi:RNA polymerase sigma-70 factor (ECF subfamily)
MSPFNAAITCRGPADTPIASALEPIETQSPPDIQSISILIAVAAKKNYPVHPYSYTKIPDVASFHAEWHSNRSTERGCMLDDRCLIDRLKQGDKEALRLVYVAHKDTLLTLAFSLVHDMNIAEDILHDVFVGFAGCVGELRLQTSLRRYLIGSVLNRARDRFRRDKTHTVEARDFLPALRISAGPEQEAVLFEETRRVSEALARLPLEPREILQLQAGGQVVRDYSLRKGAQLLITTTDEKGRPIKGVNVHAEYLSDAMGRGPKQPVRSDPNGVVFLSGLRPDVYFIVAAHPDYALAGQEVTLDGPKQVKPVVFNLQKGIDVPGVATCSDGLPASGWTVEPKPQWRKSVQSWRYNDPVAYDGTFILRHILPGPYRLEVSIPENDRVTRGVWSTDVNLPPETGLLDLKIPMSSSQGRVSISGTVRFPGDQSYDKGFWVDAMSVAASSGADMDLIAAGNFGSTFVFPGKRDFLIGNLVPGLYHLGITVAGSQRKEFWNVKAPSEGVVLEVTVAGSVSRRGRVVDRQTGRPITSFELRIVGEAEWRHVSDPNGMFQVQSRGPECKVQVKAQGYGDAISENLYREVDEPAVIELGPPVAFTGVVVDEAGRPIEGVTISYRYGQRADGLSDANDLATTDAEGHFRLDSISADDTWQWFVFRHPDYARVIKHIPPEKGPVLYEKIVLPKGGTVEGHVYDWQGKPMPDVPVYLLDEPQFSHWKRNVSRLGLARTDDTGFYRIEHMPEELCYVFPKDPYRDDTLGVVLTAILPRSRRTSRLDLGGSWKTTGRLLRNGEPVANTRFLVSYRAGFAQGFEAYTMSDSDGRFAFYGLPTGRRTIYWAVPGMRSSDKWMKLGTFAFRNLPPGQYILELGSVGAGRVSAPVHVDLGPAEHKAVQTNLAPAEGTRADSGVLVVHVVTQNGLLLATPDIWLERAGQVIEPSVDTDDRRHSAGEPGKYTLHAEYSGYRAVRTTVVMKSRQDRSVQEGREPLVITMIEQ